MLNLALTLLSSLHAGARIKQSFERILRQAIAIAVAVLILIVAACFGLLAAYHALISSDTFVPSSGTRTGFTLLPLINGAPGFRKLDRVLVIIVNAGTSGPVTLDKTAKEPTMRELERYLTKLGQDYLAPGEILTVDLLDVDLAGRFEPWQFPYHEARFMRDITWPTIKLKYRLERPGQAVLEGEEAVSNRIYLWESGFRSYVETMPYEKLMLQRWFRQRFRTDPTAKKQFRADDDQPSATKGLTFVPSRGQKLPQF